MKKLIYCLSFVIYVFLFLQNSVFSQPPPTPCGDGVCDEFEKTHPGLCPQDCKEVTPPSKPVKALPRITLYKESPFAIHDPAIPEADKPEDLVEVGAKWVRYAGKNGILWNFIEPQKGIFNWDYHDRLYLETYKNGVRMIVVILVFHRLDRGDIDTNFGYIPKDMDWFPESLQKLVERYDGDGIDDAPGSPVVDVWEIDNELDLAWKDTPENYALLLKKSYIAIKKANPNAKVAIAGIGDQGENNEGFRKYYIRIFKELDRIKDRPEDRYFDIISFHLYRPYNAKVKESIAEIKEQLTKFGYNNAPIWITETADFSGRPSFIEPREILGPVSYRSEKEQASLLIKRYVYPLANGVKKIFWGGLTESSGFIKEKVNSVWDNIGLINNPKNDGESHKKLSYYTYKKMVEVLEGSDWDNIETVQESDGIYIYKFTKQEKPIWVAWNDNQESKKVMLTLDKDAESVKITEAVPKYETGKGITDYDTAFEMETKTIREGQLTIGLTDKPVFIEE